MNLLRMVIDGSATSGLGAGLPLGQAPSHAGVVLVVVLGLALLTALVRDELFRPVAEATPMGGAAVPPGVPAAEQCLPHIPGLLRLSRPR